MGEERRTRSDASTIDAIRWQAANMRAQRSNTPFEAPAPVQVEQPSFWDQFVRGQLRVPQRGATVSAPPLGVPEYTPEQLEEISKLPPMQQFLLLSDRVGGIAEMDSTLMKQFGGPDREIPVFKPGDVFIPNAAQAERLGVEPNTPYVIPKTHILSSGNEAYVSQVEVDPETKQLGMTLRKAASVAHKLPAPDNDVEVFVDPRDIGNQSKWRTVFGDDRPAKQAAMDAGLVPFDQGQGGSTGIEAMMLESKAARDKATEIVQNSRQSFNEAADLYKKFNRGGGVLGQGNTGISKDFAGIAGRILNYGSFETMADGTTKWATGMTTGEIAEMESMATRMVAMAVPAFTAEKGGRVTEPEREISGEGTQLKGKSLKGAPEAKAGMMVVMKMAEMDAFKYGMLRGTDLWDLQDKEDFDDDKGWPAFVAHLVNDGGWNIDDAIKFADQMAAFERDLEKGLNEGAYDEEITALDAAE